MKVTSLSLLNFGPFEQSTVAFDAPIALVLGQNGTGKTTLTRAIELLLTGGVQAFRGHRLGLAALIGPAGDSAEVEATLDLGRPEPLRLRRRIRAGGLTTAVGDHEVTKSAFDFFSPSTMRNPERAWAAVCQVGGVLDREVADQKALLLDLIDPAVPPELLSGLRFDLLEGGVPQTLDGIESAYQQAYRARTGAKKRLAEAAVQEPDRPRPQLDPIERKLGDLSTREAALIAQLGAGQGQRQALERERGGAQDALDRLLIERQELGTEGEAQQALAEAQGALATAQGAQEARQKAEVQAAGSATRVEQLKRLEAALAKQGAECEACGTTLTPDKRKERVEALKVERGKLEAWLKKHGQPGLGQGVPQAERAVGDAKRRLVLIGEKDLAVEKKRHEVMGLDAELTRTPAADPAVEGELVEIRARLHKGRELLGEARALCQRWDRVEDQRIQHRKVQDEVHALERLCEVLGPTGVGERLLRERFDTVLAKLNRILARFSLEMGVRASPAWGLGFNGRPAIMLSGSERFRAGVALQVSVGALTGAKLAIVDGADILDGPNRKVLITLARDAVEKGLCEQLIVTSTVPDVELARRADQFEAPIRSYYLPAPGQIEARA